MDIEVIKEQLAAVYRGKKWIIVIEAAAGATSIVEALKENGADSIMIVAPLAGVGEVPDVDRIHYTGATAGTMILGIRAFTASVDQPSNALVEAINTFDPDGEALILNTSFSRATEIFGRPSYGARHPDWRALEDKMIVDDLWDAAGVERAPAEIVPVSGAAEAAERLQSDMGTVWVADNKEGWHGGGEYVRWIREPSDEEAAIAWFSEHADLVRVMPFLDGLPCSIHGFITRNGVAVFKPVELHILRHTDRAAFYYAQGGTFWNAPEAVEHEMRAAARSVGAVLARDHGYLGSFGIDEDEPSLLI